MPLTLKKSTICACLLHITPAHGDAPPYQDCLHRLSVQKIFSPPHSSLVVGHLGNLGPGHCKQMRVLDPGRSEVVVGFPSIMFHSYATSDGF